MPDLKDEASPGSYHPTAPLAVRHDFGDRRQLPQ
jgi:hypothetical protein